MIGPLCDDRDVTECDEINQRLKQACEQPFQFDDPSSRPSGVYTGLGGTDVADGTFCIVEGTWAVVDLYAYYSACRGVTIRTDGSNAVCIFDLSLDDPESDSATGSVPRALLVLSSPGCWPSACCSLPRLLIPHFLLLPVLKRISGVLKREVKLH